MRRPIVLVLALVGAHELLARVLDRFDLVERLLAPGGEALAALPLAGLLYALRLTALFVAPPLFAIALARTLSRP